MGLMDFINKIIGTAQSGTQAVNNANYTYNSAKDSVSAAKQTVDNMRPAEPVAPAPIPAPEPMPTPMAPEPAPAPQPTPAPVQKPMSEPIIAAPVQAPYTEPVPPAPIQSAAPMPEVQATPISVSGTDQPVA